MFFLYVATSLSRCFIFFNHGLLRFLGFSYQAYYICVIRAICGFDYYYKFFFNHGFLRFLGFLGFSFQAYYIFVIRAIRGFDYYYKCSICDSFINS